MNDENKVLEENNNSFNTLGETFGVSKEVTPVAPGEQCLFIPLKVKVSKNH